MKTYELKTEYGNYKVNIEVNHFAFDNSLAVDLVEVGTGEPIARLTVCLSDEDDKPYSLVTDSSGFIDTNNNRWAEDFIIKNKLGVFTGFMGDSGWCSYPLYEFDLDKLGE